MAGGLHRNLVKISEAVLPSSSAAQLRSVVRGWRKRGAERSKARRQDLWNRHAGHGDIVVKLQPRVRIRLHFDSVLCRHIYLDDFEAEERCFLNLFLRSGEIFVDVGANVGLFSVIAARLLGRRGSVYSFEPCGSTFQRLRDNIQLNHYRNVTCSQLALSDVSQSTEMIVSCDGFDGWNSFAKPYTGEKFSTELVTTTTWDDFACKNQLTGRVALMKIDVEGWEKKVLLGGERELAHPDAPVLQVEFTDSAAQAAGFSCQDVYRLLNSLGYEICRFQADLKRLVPDPIREAYPYCNLFAVKDLAAAQRRLNERS